MWHESLEPSSASQNGQIELWREISLIFIANIDCQGLYYALLMKYPLVSAAYFHGGMPSEVPVDLGSPQIYQIPVHTAPHILDTMAWPCQKCLSLDSRLPDKIVQMFFYVIGFLTAAILSEHSTSIVPLMSALHNASHPSLLLLEICTPISGSHPKVRGDRASAQADVVALGPHLISTCWSHPQ